MACASHTTLNLQELYFVVFFIGDQQRRLHQDYSRKEASHPYLGTAAFSLGWAKQLGLALNPHQLPATDGREDNPWNLDAWWLS